MRKFALIFLLFLSACVSQQKIQKTRADYSNFTTERRDRSIEQSCADQAMPGSAANLECQMAAQKKAQQDAHAPAH